MAFYALKNTAKVNMFCKMTQPLTFCIFFKDSQNIKFLVVLKNSQQPTTGRFHGLVLWVSLYFQKIYETAATALNRLV